MTTENTYTQEQMDIELLKNTNGAMLTTLSRLEYAIDSNFKWTLSLMLGLYAIVMSGLISAACKAMGVL